MGTLHLDAYMDFTFTDFDLVFGPDILRGTGVLKNSLLYLIINIKPPVAPS